MNESNKYFLSIFWSLIEQSRNADNALIKFNLIGALKESLKKWTDVYPAYVSEAVIELLNKMHITSDPFKLLWKDREIAGTIAILNKKGNAVKKSKLAWEHTTPLSEFLKTIIKAESQEQLAKEMNNYSGVCWILREEDNELIRQGFQSKRPGGWEACYEKCGIKPKINPNYN